MSRHTTVAARLASLAVAAMSLTAAPAVAAPASGSAEMPTESATAASMHFDAEIDPTAYALAGNSIHVGIGYRRFRLDLGNFALAIPQWVHGDDGFDVSFVGYGAKLQVFPLAEQRGLFVGIDGEVSRVLIQRQGTDLAVRQRQVSLGAHVGYRFSVVERLYVTPWIGVGYQFGADDVTLGDAAYRGMAISVFPAIHLGYQFR